MEDTIKKKYYTHLNFGTLGFQKIWTGITIVLVLTVGVAISYFLLLAAPECNGKVNDERIECFERNAATRKYDFQSTYICKKINDTSRRDDCFVFAGSKKTQTSLCAKVVNLAKRDTCFLDVAKVLSDDSICTKISRIEERDTCYVDVTKTTNKKSTCDLIADSLKRKNCYCNDEDNGIYIFQRGVVTDRKNSRNEDSCFYKDEVFHLKEWYCDDDGYAQYEDLACNTVCSNGTCGGPNLSGGISQAQLPRRSSVECSDSDGGENIYKKGVTTGVDRCIYNGVTQDCASAPATRTDSCTEDYNIVTGERNTQVREWFCGPDGRLTINTRLCDNGCINGACRR